MEILNPVSLRYYWIVESDLWVCFCAASWLEVWVLLIKLPQGWRRPPRHHPVWPSRPAGTNARLRALQHLAPKVLRQHVFAPSWPFPLTLSFISLLSLSFLQPPLVTHTPLAGCSVSKISNAFFSFCFKLLGHWCHSGHWIKDKLLCRHRVWYNLVSTSVSVFVTFFLSTSFLPPVFSLATLFRCLGWLQKKKKIARREDTATESRSRRGKRGECKLLSRLQRTAQRHECEY